MVTSNNNPLNEDVGDAADELVQDVRRGARRVGRAVTKGAEAIDDAVRPGFGEQLSETLCSIGGAPSRTVDLTRDLVRDHPVASLATVAVAAAFVTKCVAMLRR